MKFDPSKLVQLVRPRYWAGQLLTAEDLRAEQEYQLQRQWQHNRMLHGYGIVVGLEVGLIENDKGWQAIVAPGYALDGWGREIVVTEPLTVNLPGDRGDLMVYLKYVESPADPDAKHAKVSSPRMLPPDHTAELVLQSSSPERTPAPTGRADFAIPLARLRRPHLTWQRDRAFRPPRAR